MNINIVTLVSLIISVGTFGWTIIQYSDTRKREQNIREFEHFHKLLKELVQPESEKDIMYLDRQTAVIYELRHFKRYYPYSLRTLKGLREKWAQVPNQFPRLIEEIDLTIIYLETRLKVR